jgi:hypothetical protein
VAQKAARQPSETACKGWSQETQTPGIAGVCVPLQYYTKGQMEAAGSEPTPNSSENQGSSEQGNAKYNALADGPRVTDDDRASFRILAIAWLSLTQKDKQEILAIIRRATNAAR